MAIVKIKPIKVRVNSAIDYITNEEKVKNNNYGKSTFDDYDIFNSLNYIENVNKTEMKKFVTGINCSVENAAEEMRKIKELYGKTNKILAFHIIQSFDYDEVSPDLAHKIGVEFAKEIWGNRFQVVVATHLNTEHYHNHIIVNSVSFLDGKKYYDTHESYSVLRNVSNNICKEYGLSTMEEKKMKSGINYQNFYNKYFINNRYKNIKDDVDLAIRQAYSFTDFKALLKKMDYEVELRSGKISLTEKNHKRPIRIERTLGENYSVDKIKERIINENEIRVPFIENKRIKISKSNSIKPFYPGKKFYKRIYKKHGLINLFYHYCYLLRRYSGYTNRNTNYASSLMRKDIKKLEEYSKQANFLKSNELNNIEDFEDFKNRNNKSLESFLDRREKIWKLRKNEKVLSKQNEYTTEIVNITNKINNLKSDLKMISDIESNIPQVKSNVRNLKEYEQNKENQKEKIGGIRI